MAGTTEIRLAGLTIPDFADHVADPSRYSGGGSVGAAAAAFSASLAELVMTLSRNRKSNQPNIDIIDRDLANMRALRDRFIGTIDEDARLLDKLMALYGSRSPETEAEYTKALILAADEPLRLATDVKSLLQIILTQVKFASRFTVADLAAAAAIGSASAFSALMMTEVNLSLLEKREPSDTEKFAEMAARRTQLSSELTALNDDIQARCNSKIQRGSNATDKGVNN